MRTRHSPAAVMEYARLSSLLVIAILQLSQTEITSTLPEAWYAANVINDGVYSPRPLSEIFSTQATFSSTNPIVVLPSSTATPNRFISTSNSPNTTPAISTTFETVTESPATEVSVLPLSTDRPVQPLPAVTFATQPPPTPTVLTTTTEATQRPQPQQPQQPTLPQFQQNASPSPPQSSSIPQQISLPQLPSIPQQISLPQLPSLPQQISSPQLPSMSQQNTPPQLPSLPQQFSPAQFQSTPQQISPAQYPSMPQQIQIQTAQQVPLIPNQQAPNMQPNYFFMYQPVPASVTPTTVPPSILPTQAPATNVSVPPANSQFPTFKIRMIAPSGSFTKVRIAANPTAPTTTRRPSRRRNRNDYDDCVDDCEGIRQPLCASPLGESPIDPDKLRGFPSGCQMACHNSFRKTLYEKVADGKCGRLRTRIRPLDANKLTKNDLNQASYTIVQNEPTVLEFSPLNS